MENSLIIPLKHKPPDFNNTIYEEKFGKCKKAWKWHDKDGNWIYCTVVYINVESKVYKQFVYKNNEWIIEDLKNNVLFNLPEIIKNNKDIVILDNEISIDILNLTNKEDFIFTTWTGDVSEIANTDFSYLENKKTYYMSSSWAISKQVIYFLRERLNNLIVVEPAVDRHGWNIADDFLSLRLNRQEVKGWITNLQLTEIEKKELTIKENRNKIKPFIENIKFPFGILGPYKKSLWFMSHETGELFSVTKGKLNPNHLLYLAPLDFWETYFSDESKKVPTMEWLWALDAVNRACNSVKKLFSPHNVRGRGAWLENGKLLLHTGEDIIYEDKKIHVRKFKNNSHIYERLPEKRINLDCESLSDETRKKIWNCLKKLSIQNEIELYYLIGWMILSPFCGALDWKPHMWITGPSGSGKSTVIDIIIKCFTGNFSESLHGTSTSAGINQLSQTDSISIIYDEAEPNEESRTRIKNILYLARSVRSQDSTAIVAKGTSNQDGIQFINNRMYCLGSVHELLTNEMDKSRFSVVRMTNNLKHDWKDLEPEIMECFTKKIGNQIRKRTYLNFERLQKNIKSFRYAVGHLLKKQRKGDQIGTLLAGALFFLNNNEYDYDNALKICMKILKNFDTIDEHETSDEIKCLYKIFTNKIKWTNYADKIEETTLLYLVTMGFEKADNNNGIEDDKAKNEVLKYGIRCDTKNNIVYMAGNHTWIKELLKKTEWEYTYSKVLRGLSFIENNTRAIRFGAHGTYRALIIEADYILRLSDDNIYMESGID